MSSSRLVVCRRLGEHLLGADHVHAVAELDARRGQGVVVGALRARLLLDRVEQVFEHHAVALEADRVGVGQVVGDGLQLQVLRLHAGLADPHCWIHGFLPVVCVWISCR
jgi:hypothetical protein